MKRIIIIIMIFVISITIVFMPIRNPFGWHNRYIPLTDVSAEEMGIYGYAPAFIAWFLSMLASMGLNISSLGEFQELLQQVEFKAIVDDHYFEYQGMTPSEMAGAISANQWKDSRDAIQSWISSDEAIDLKNFNITEYLQQLNSIGGTVKEINGQQTFIIGNGGGSNLLTSIAMPTDLAGKQAFIKTFTNNSSYCQTHGIRYTGISDSQLLKCYIYNIETGVDIGGYWYSAWSVPVNHGWLYTLETATNYNPDINDLIGHIRAYPMAIFRLNNTSTIAAFEYNQNPIGITDLYMTDVTVPTWTTDNKLNVPISNDVISTGDYVHVDIDTQLQNDLTELYNREIAMTDVDIPAGVGVTTNNPVITNVIVNNTTVAIPEVDIDFPDIDNFKIPTGITTKFPFSIPFDVYRAFQMLEATPEVPHWEIPIRVENIVDETIVIDLEDYQGLINIVRWFLLAIFILGLILATRGLIKG